MFERAAPAGGRALRCTEAHRHHPVSTKASGPRRFRYSSEAAARRCDREWIRKIWRSRRLAGRPRRTRPGTPLADPHEDGTPTHDHCESPPMAQLTVTIITHDEDFKRQAAQLLRASSVRPSPSTALSPTRSAASQTSGARASSSSAHTAGGAWAGCCTAASRRTCCITRRARCSSCSERQPTSRRGSPR